MKRYIILITAIFSFYSCGKISSSLDNYLVEKEIETFWNWFKKNENRFRTSNIEKVEILKEISTKTNKIETELAFELAKSNKGIFLLTISADGMKKYISLVQKIVEKSPKIKGWEIIAFRQKESIEKFKEIEYVSDSLTINPLKMKFFPFVEKDSLELIIYTSELTEENYNEIFYGGSILLDNLIGELNFMRKVKNYDFHKMPTETKEIEQLKPILELPTYINNFKIKK